VFWSLLILVEIFMPFFFMLLLLYAAKNWYLAVPASMVIVFEIAYLLRRFAKLKLAGLRAQLKEKGVQLDPEKLAAAKVKNT